MKKVALLFISALVAVLSFGQDKKDLAVSFSTGIFTSPYYPNAKAREYYNVDFDYHLATRHLLSANFNAGKHRYYDMVLSNVPVSPEIPTNAEASYLTFSILYKFKFLNKQKVSANIGAGAGIMTHISEYEYWEPNRGDVRQSVWTNLAFPVRVDFDYKLSRRFRFGVMGGLFIQPDDSVLGYHVGPRLSYVVK